MKLRFTVKFVGSPVTDRLDIVVVGTRIHDTREVQVHTMLQMFATERFLEDLLGIRVHILSEEVEG